MENHKKIIASKVQQSRDASCHERLRPAHFFTFPLPSSFILILEEPTLPR